MKKVSVVIPAYNEESQITNAIEAVLLQSYENFEIIVVDNNSTDNTSAVVATYLDDKRIRLVHEPKQGILYARQAGIDHATGEIIAQLDADCVPDRHWLKKGMAHFNDNRIVGVTGPYYYGDAAWYLRYFTFVNQLLFFGLISWYVQKRSYGALMIGGNAFIRTDVLKAAGGYNTALTFYGEDTDTACRIAKQGPLLFLNNLTMPTSARRFTAQGFFSVTKKYNQAFLAIMSGKGVASTESKETVNPR